MGKKESGEDPDTSKNCCLNYPFYFSLLNYPFVHFPDSNACWFEISLFFFRALRANVPYFGKNFTRKSYRKKIPEMTLNVTQVTRNWMRVQLMRLTGSRPAIRMGFEK